MFKNIKKVHFVGIGGIGMSGIAEIILNRGFEVSGSDKSLSEITRRLSDLGMKIYEGHSPENLMDADVLVYSSAVTIDNPEVQAAVKRKIPIIKRAEMLAECMRMQYGIGIAGTHGKTTTTSMVGLTLTEGKLDPTIIVGGKLSGLGGTNARLGNGEFIVVEADEFDRTFLKLTPTIAAITTLESEHLDTYKDLEDIKSAFIEFVNKVPFYGFVVLCLDEPALQDIIPQINKKALESFTGVYRRFEVKYNEKIMVVDDYAHHPTETSATLAGIRSGWSRRLVAVFQPHLFSRTRDFYQEFGRSFLNSDVFICTDIYPAREEPIEGVTGELIADAARSFGHKNVIYIENKNDVIKVLNDIKRDGDIMVTMGAGDIWKIGEKFVEGLSKK